jgi:hypothetical protein
MALARTSSTMLKWYGGSRYPCLVVNLCYKTLSYGFNLFKSCKTIQIMDFISGLAVAQVVNRVSKKHQPWVQPPEPPKKR